MPTEIKAPISRTSTRKYIITIVGDGTESQYVMDFTFHRYRLDKDDIPLVKTYEKLSSEEFVTIDCNVKIIPQYISLDFGYELDAGIEIKVVVII